jgi:hypothetical protein
MVGVEQKFLKIWRLYTVGNGIFRLFPTEYFNILALLNNEDKHCYLQLKFNVCIWLGKLRKFWKFGVFR